MHRFIVPPGSLAIGTGGRLLLSPAESHHAAVVLRLRPGDPVQLLDGNGAVTPARLVDVDRKGCGVELGEVRVEPRRPTGICLVAAVTKGRAWDWTLQKSTELGVDQIQPILAERSVVRLERAEVGRRREEWQRAVEEAAKQCGTAWIPTVMEPVALGAGMRLPTADDVALVASLDADRCEFWTPFQGRPRVSRVWVAVGPEGDWTPDEMGWFRKAGYRGVTLGNRVLRAETAAAAAVALADYELRRCGATE